MNFIDIFIFGFLLTGSIIITIAASMQAMENWMDNDIYKAIAYLSLAVFIQIVWLLYFIDYFLRLFL